MTSSKKLWARLGETGGNTSTRCPIATSFLFSEATAAGTFSSINSNACRHTVLSIAWVAVKRRQSSGYRFTLTATRWSIMMRHQSVKRKWPRCLKT